MLNKFCHWIQVTNFTLNREAVKEKFGSKSRIHGVRPFLSWLRPNAGGIAPSSGQTNNNKMPPTRCNVCGRNFKAAHYYMAHLKYPKNHFCKAEFCKYLEVSPSSEPHEKRRRLSSPKTPPVFSPVESVNVEGAAVSLEGAANSPLKAVNLMSRLLVFRIAKFSRFRATPDWDHS